MTLFASPVLSENRIVRRAATLCRTRLGWVVVAIAIHGLIFFILSSLPSAEEASQTFFPVEIIAPNTTHQRAESKPEKTEPVRTPTPRVAPPTPLSTKQETMPLSPPAPASIALPAPPVASQTSGASSAAPTPSKATDAAPASIVPPSYDAAYLHNPQPPYPPLASRLRETGTVLLRVYVLPNGLPDAVEIKTTSGSPRLDRAAQAWVKANWRFVPARQGNEAVADWVTTPITFTIVEKK